MYNCNPEPRLTLSSDWYCYYYLITRLTKFVMWNGNFHDTNGFQNGHRSRISLYSSVWVFRWEDIKPGITSQFDSSKTYAVTFLAVDACFCMGPWLGLSPRISPWSFHLVFWASSQHVSWTSEVHNPDNKLASVFVWCSFRVTSHHPHVVISPPRFMGKKYRLHLSKSQESHYKKNMCVGNTVVTFFGKYSLTIWENKLFYSW